MKKHGCVLVLGWVFNVVVFVCQTTVLCQLWVVFTLLLCLFVAARFVLVLGVVLQCSWESQFKHGVVLVSGWCSNGVRNCILSKVLC